MAFCANCGQELDVNAKFCVNCGHANTKHSQQQEQRKVVYDGEIHKCPNCGEILNSFTSQCSFCGYELRGVKASNSISEFSFRLEQANSEEQQITLIRNFPIPNTKEDIFEFMILASTNIQGELKKEILNSWITKFEQSYEKAALVFGNDADFIKFQSIYNQTKNKINKNKKIRVAKKIWKTTTTSAPMLPQIAISLGWLISIFVLIPLCGDNLDNVGFNSFQLFIILDFIAGSIILPHVIQKKFTLPMLITIVGLLIVLSVLIPLCGINLDNAGFNSYQMILFVGIITSAVIFVKIFKKKD